MPKIGKTAKWGTARKYKTSEQLPEIKENILPLLEIITALPLEPASNEDPEGGNIASFN